LTSAGIEAHAVDWLRPPNNIERWGFRVRFVDWLDAVGKAIERARAPVVLLGHSFGGFLISAAAERWPDRVAGLVYVAAYLPVSGENLRQSWSRDAESHVRSAVRFHPLRGTVSIRPHEAIDLFYGDCPPDVARAATRRLVEQAMRPAGHRVRLTERSERIRKVYVQTSRDRAISYRHQQMMCRRTTLDATFVLETDHSPFLSAPQALADIVAGRQW
jgi:pimeloyl-ACP methyl ester carboxylesterase